MSNKPGTKAESAALTRVSGEGLHIPNVHEGSSPSSGTTTYRGRFVFLTDGMTPEQKAWRDLVEALYRNAGIDKATYFWHEGEGGVLVDYGGVEAVHSLHAPAIEATVQYMALQMQLPAIELGEGGVEA